MTIAITFILAGVLYVAIIKAKDDRRRREQHRERFDSVYSTTRAGAASSDVGDLK